MDRVTTVKEVFWDSWELAKKNIWILLGLTVFQFVFIIILSLFAGVLGGASGLVLTLFDAFYTVAFYQVFFKLIDDPDDASFPDVIPNLVKAFNFMIVKLIIGLVLVFLIAVISSIYFINTPQIEIDSQNPFSWEMLPIFILISIPITYFTIRLCFVVCFIVDQDSGTSESISQSWTLTDGHFWFVLRLFLLILGVNILGAMAFGLGTLFSIPFSSLIIIIAYRHMVNSYTDEEEILLDDVEGNDGN
ncbi:MAG: glycerophosphoryl diester phosphodiesterase membrane domain-containing protein [Bacteroidota bacterium]